VSSIAQTRKRNPHNRHPGESRDPFGFSAQSNMGPGFRRDDALEGFAKTGTRDCAKTGS
jgi:hypothetical protein